MSDKLSDKTKEEYIRSIFRGYSPEEIDTWMNILDSLYKNEGSITQTAEKLFIHKNTLQYRLNKLADQTGYDPRSIRFSSLYYNAIHFYADVKDKFLIYNF